MLFRSNLDSGPKRKLYVYILFGFLQKGDVWGKNVCSPRPAPTIQSFPLHSTKPKESFKRKDAGAWGGGRGQILFHRYRWVVANQKWSNPQGNTKRTENQKAKPSRKKMDFHETDFRLSWSQAKMSNQNGGSATVNDHTVYSCPVLIQACHDLTHPSAVLIT